MHRVAAIALPLALVSVLTACGAGRYPLAPSPVSPVSPGAGQNRPVKTHGAITLKFVDNRSIQTVAPSTARITLSSPALATPFVQAFTWASARSVRIDSLPVGTYEVQVDILDELGASMGKASAREVGVSADRTTDVSLKVAVAPSRGGSISLGVILEQASGSLTPVATGGIPVSTASIAPSPSPSATPSPAVHSLQEDFSGTLERWSTNWTPSSYKSDTVAATGWSHVAAAGNPGGAACAGGAAGAVIQTGTYDLTLKTGLDLSKATAPRLRFDLDRFVPRDYFESSKFIVEVSGDGGSTWASILEQTTAIASWKSFDLSLGGKAGSDTRVRFRFVYDYYLGTDSHVAPVLDNVSISAS